jgi:hypothetical protein
MTNLGAIPVRQVRSNYPEESFQHKCCGAHSYSPCAETFVCGTGKWQLTCAEKGKKGCIGSKRKFQEVQIRYLAERHRPRKASASSGDTGGGGAGETECAHEYDGPTDGFLSGYPDGTRKGSPDLAKAKELCNHNHGCKGITAEVMEVADGTPKTKVIWTLRRESQIHPPDATAVAVPGTKGVDEPHEQSYVQKGCVGGVPGEWAPCGAVIDPQVCTNTDLYLSNSTLVHPTTSGEATCGADEDLH